MSEYFPESSESTPDAESLVIFDEIDQIISQAIYTGDPGVAVAYGNRILMQVQLRGVALAKFLYTFRQAWDGMLSDIGVTDGERFEDMVEAQMGLSPQTTRKYSELWAAIFLNPEISELVKKQLLGKPIKTLNLLVAVAKEGGLSADDWEEVVQSPTEGEIRQLVRQRRGQATSSKTAMVLYMTPTGTIKAKQGEEHAESVGFLNLDQAKDNPLIEKAIDRIVDKAGILWQ